MKIVFSLVAKTPSGEFISGAGSWETYQEAESNMEEFLANTVNHSEFREVSVHGHIEKSYVTDKAAEFLLRRPTNG